MRPAVCSAWYTLGRIYRRGCGETALSENHLLNLPIASLDLLRGDRRTRLIAYLERWGHHATLLRYLDHWLDAQPEQATLGEARARALIATGRADEALHLLNALDAARGQTQTRWLLRLRALKGAGRTDDLRALARRPETIAVEDISRWLTYGDVCRAAGDLGEAAEAFGYVMELAPESGAPLRRLAELALETGDAATARGHLETLFVRTPDRRPTIEELHLLRSACEALEDTAAVAALTTQLAQREHEERAALESDLGLQLDDT